MILTIEGNIGAGKSTFLEDLKSKLGRENVVYLQEPVEEWQQFQDTNGKNILEHFYEDVSQFSFPFQIMALITRAERLKKAKTDFPNSIIISERSMFTDREVFARMLHNDGKLSDMLYSIYLKCFDLYTHDLDIDGIIYLKTNPETCAKRVVKRNRKGESISLGYLQKCNDTHDGWILRSECHDHLPVLTLNNERHDTDVHYREHLIENTRCFIDSLV